MSDMLELKKLVINELAGQFDAEEKKKIAKEFGLTSEQLDQLIKKLLDKWLYSVDFVVMLANILGLSAPRKAENEKSERKSRHYIG